MCRKIQRPVNYAITELIRAIVYAGGGFRQGVVGADGGYDCLPLLVGEPQMNYDFQRILPQDADVQPPATMLPIGNVPDPTSIRPTSHLAVEASVTKSRLGERGGMPSTGKAERGLERL
jgi:hypothetical protein